MPLQATSGAGTYDAFGGGAAAVPTYIEDVFSTYLYTGNGSAQTITNGIDLADKGGLVWTKCRNDGTLAHRLNDTVRGITNRLFSNLTSAESASATSITAVSSTGYTVGSENGFNQNTNTFVSWTFRKQPKFFDVVTYTGNGVQGRQISHSLASTPGFIVIKERTGGGGWVCYHRSLPTNYIIYLQSTGNAANAGSPNAYVSSPTSTTFTVGSDNDVNASGVTYVAYLFAHDAGGFGLTGTDNVISCGSFSTDGSGNATVNLGYEPQWILAKRTNAADSWLMVDNMRGFVSGPAVNTSDDARLSPNLSNAEAINDFGRPTATGFEFNVGVLNSNYIYIAIRRGPMKTPTSGTSVFAPVARSGTGSTATVSNGITTDLIISKTRNTSGISSGVWDRLRGFPAYLATTGTASESTSSDSVTAMNNTSYVLGADGGTDRINRSGYTYANWTFSRAPGFFDEVCYTGDGVAGRTVTHNLTVVPEMMIVKARNYSGGRPWTVYHSALGATQFTYMNETTTPSTNPAAWNDTAPTASVFTLGSNSIVNFSGTNYVWYGFATCPGVSKVGSYTGTGALQTINCGFTGGARFVLIHRTDAVGDWYVWDSARGITSGNDPYLLTNSTAAEVTNTNYVDTDTTGFKVTAAAPAAINANGGTFIYLAIA